MEESKTAHEQQFPVCCRTLKSQTERNHSDWRGRRLHVVKKMRSDAICTYSGKINWNLRFEFEFNRVQHFPNRHSSWKGSRRVAPAFSAAKTCKNIAKLTAKISRFWVTKNDHVGKMCLFVRTDTVISVQSEVLAVFVCNVSRLFESQRASKGCRKDAGQGALPLAFRDSVCQSQSKIVFFVFFRLQKWNERKYCSIAVFRKFRRRRRKNAPTNQAPLSGWRKRNLDLDDLDDLDGEMTGFFVPGFVWTLKDPDTVPVLKRKGLVNCAYLNLKYSKQGHCQNDWDVVECSQVRNHESGRGHQHFKRRVLQGVRKWNTSGISMSLLE